MTPLESKVRGILEKYGEFGQHALLKAILALIEVEVRAERERCAKIAEIYNVYRLDDGGNEWILGAKETKNRIATAIRSSGEGK